MTNRLALLASFLIKYETYSNDSRVRLHYFDLLSNDQFVKKLNRVTSVQFAYVALYAPLGL